MDIEEIVRLYNFIFQYVLNRYCESDKLLMARMLRVSKKTITGWLKQMKNGQMSYVATGKAILLCIREGWSLDEVKAAYIASGVASTASLTFCPYHLDAADMLSTMENMINRATGSGNRSKLAKKALPLMEFLVNEFCINRHQPGICMRQMDYLTKGKCFCFDECPCKKYIDLLEEIRGLIYD